MKLIDHWQNLHSPNLVDFDDGCGTVPGDWRKEPPTIRKYSRQAKDVREKFKHSFMNEGKQHKQTFKGK